MRPNKALFFLLCTVLITMSAKAYSNKQRVLGTNNQHEVICPEDSNTCYPLQFKAEKDFKPILPHQIVPSGLHYRINIETGLKEAKLPENSSTTSSSSSSDLAIISSPRNQYSDLISRLSQSKLTEESLAVLASLDDTDIDGLDEGRDLMTVGAEMFRTLLDDSGNVADGVKAKVASIIGQAVQNNPAAQTLALKSGLLISLISLLSSSSSSTLHDVDLTSKYLYALGSLIRSNAENVAEFYAVNGLNVLSLVMKEYKNKGSKQIVDRVEQLVWDVMDDAFFQEGVKIPVADKRQMKDWCDVVRTLGERGIGDEEGIDWSLKCKEGIAAGP
ncbi:hypothetical protein SeLEV6574_g01711 [Synchytrium endobioticum]|nr:hypothetical protein SeLEV6574_g01711 [Synchytrium endobioticum]